MTAHLPEPGIVRVRLIGLPADLPQVNHALAAALSDAGVEVIEEARSDPSHTGAGERWYLITRVPLAGRPADPDGHPAYTHTAARVITEAAMPAPLIEATTDHRSAAITTDLYAARIAARSPYRLKSKEGPDPDGYQRQSCPAAGPRPKIMCPLREASLSPRDGRIKVFEPPQDPPRICRQSAITIAPGAGARHRQDLPFATPAWHDRYATLRNTIEGLNGFIKDPAREAIAAAARRRIRGIAACSIFCAVLLMAANLRKIRGWRSLTADHKTSQATRRARRRRTSLRDHLPDG